LQILLFPKNTYYKNYKHLIASARGVHVNVCWQKKISEASTPDVCWLLFKCIMPEASSTISK